MSDNEVNVPLPTPPTGFDTSIVQQEYNPEIGHFEPPLKARPLTASIASGTLAAPNALLAVAAGVVVWVYQIMLANTSAAAETAVITYGAFTYTVEIPANNSIPIISTPSAPIFFARNATAAAVNMTFGSDVAGAVTATITYVTK